MATQARAFSVSTAYSVKSKFEEAYKVKMDGLKKVPSSVPQPENKAEYGEAYYN